MQKGFTIVELLVVIFIFGVIASMSFNVYKSAQAKNQTALAANSLAFAFRRAQVQAQSQDGDAQWGVKIQKGAITIFQGSSYALRNMAFDETDNIAGTISFSGLSEVAFSKMYGLPQAIGTTTITGFNNQIINVAINSKGTVSY